MKVALRTDGPTRAWHCGCAEALARDGHALAIRRVPASMRVPSGSERLIALERRLYGTASVHFAIADGRVDSDLDAADLVLEPRFDGIAGEAALIGAILAGHAPRVEIVEPTRQTARLRAAGLPAIERPDVLARALDTVLARTIQLVVRAVREANGPPVTLPLSEPVAVRRPVSPPQFLARTLGGKLQRRLVAPRGRVEDWRIGIRRLENDGAADHRAWPTSRYMLLPNDGRRFQADPFLFTHEGRTCLFYEDFPHATRKGVIMAVDLDAAGRPSPPRCVLEHAAHLSYPVVFAHEGSIYMLPEMGAARRIQLFRADPFPDRWTPDRVLVDDVVTGDATLVRHEGRWWMFATQAGDGGSTWDALALFHAPDLFGPWTPHPGNPVLIDAGAARPAGAMWHEDGVLMRVAQDCRGGYGAGLAICRVDRLDSEGYAQTFVARLGAPERSGANRVHTLNRTDVYEAIDLHFPPGGAARQPLG